MSGSLVKKFKKLVFRESVAGAGTSFELRVPDEATIGQLYYISANIPRQGYMNNIHI